MITQENVAWYFKGAVQRTSTNEVVKSMDMDSDASEHRRVLNDTGDEIYHYKNAGGHKKIAKLDAERVSRGWEIDK